MAAISASVATSSARARPHDLAAQRAVAHQEPGVDAEVALERAQVLAEGRPGPRHALLERGQGHALDLGHHAADVVGVLGVDRGQGEAAVPADDRGDAVQVGGRRRGVPEELGVVVGVGIDHPGDHHEAGGIEFGGPGLAHRTDGDDPAVGNAHVGRAGPALRCRR